MKRCCRMGGKISAGSPCKCRRFFFFILILAILLGGYVIVSSLQGREGGNVENFSGKATITLPKAEVKGEVSVEQAIKNRRSIREYKKSSLNVQQISQLLWAAQGQTSDQGLRAAPSAGALYPVEMYVVVGDVQDLDAGVYKYKHGEHILKKVVDGDVRKELSDAALSQDWIKLAPVVLVLCGVYSRVTKKYGQRGNQYVHMEIGAVAENVYLQAASLGLGTVFVGAFDDDDVRRVLGAKEHEVPLCVLPIGQK